MPSDEQEAAAEAARRLKQGQIDEGVARVIALLNDARRAIVQEVQETDWDRFALPRLKAAIDRHLDHWRDLAQQGLSADQAEFWALGAEAGSTTLTATGAPAPALSPVEGFEPSTSLLQAMQQQAGTRITKLAEEAKAKIDQILTRSLLAGEPRHAAIEAIGRQLERGDLAGRPQSIFASVAKRAAFIYEHEVSQLYAAARFTRIERAARYRREFEAKVAELEARGEVTGLLPTEPAETAFELVWLHLGHPKTPRDWHVAMHGQRRKPGEKFQSPKGPQLGFPRDPEAPFSETAYCTCELQMYSADLGPFEAWLPAPTGMAIA